MPGVVCGSFSAFLSAKGTSSHAFGVAFVANVGCFATRKWVAFFADSPAITARVFTSANSVLPSTRFMISVIASPTRRVCVFKAVERSSRWWLVIAPWVLFESWTGVFSFHSGPSMGNVTVLLAVNGLWWPGVVFGAGIWLRGVLQ